MPLGRVRGLILGFVIVCIAGGTAAAENLEHRVVPGDTLYSIARQNGVDVDELMAINGIEDARELRVGQILRIPGEEQKVIAETYDLENYEIQLGDTLFGISRRTGMSVSEIRSINNLPDNTILPGQIIRVKALENPAPPEETSVQAVSGRDDRAREGTLLSNTPSTGGDELYWPHPGQRFEFNGKFPGVVIRGETGDDIRSVSSGRVVYSGPHSTLGNVVFVQNPRGYIFIYGGNRELFVEQGQEIDSSDRIGTLGPSPLLSEVQVYFSVWKEGRYVDPNSAPR